VKIGGALVVAQTSEPKTFNPVMAVDQGTRDVLSVLSADLVHINRLTLRTEPALAKSCVVSADGRHYTVTLRDGLHFSDGAPISADDVVFSFRVYLDERVNSPQRDVLIVDRGTNRRDQTVDAQRAGGSPRPRAPGERLFDSFWILPKHKLERAFVAGKFPQTWTVGTAVDELVASGPFRGQTVSARTTADPRPQSVLLEDVTKQDNRCPIWIGSKSRSCLIRTRCSSTAVA
jgi:peptide/nickel transport system substrate-binding protein